MANKDSRLKNSIRNSAVGLITQAITLILGFLARSVFVKTLAEDYLGVNGLFTNILTVLSFAELGVGNAIVFGLYKPIRDNDEDKIAQCVTFYKTAYRLIGIIVAAVGLCVAPFLDIIIVDKPNIPENLTFIYLLYLANTVLSYFMVWKRTFMTANQEKYIGTVTEQIFTTIQVVLQIIFLYKTHNFVVYLLIMIVCNQVRNVVISFICTKRYPIVTKKPQNALPKNERKSIFKNVRALFLYKLATVALDGTDNILLQAVINFKSVVLYANYSMITTAFQKLCDQILTGVTASVGNLNAGDDAERKESILYRLQFLTLWLYGLLSAGFAATVNSLISAWLGNEFLLDTPIVLAISFSFFIQGMEFPTYTYRTTMGLFREGRTAPVISALLNITLSIILGKIFGMAGIFAATGLSRLLTTTWFDAHLIFTKKLGKSAMRYYLTYLKYFIFAALVTLCCEVTAKTLPLSGWIGAGCKIIVCGVLYNVLFLAVFCGTNVFKEVFNMLLRRDEKWRK